MKYEVRLLSCGKCPNIPISKEEFFELVDAREKLRCGYSLEEKFDYLIANYLDWERALIDMSLSGIVRSPQSYSEIQVGWGNLNLRLINLLTSTKLYLDQSPQDLKKVLSSQVIATDQLNMEKKRLYDKCFNYRLMEAMRNHVQHRGTPIHFFKPETDRHRGPNESIEFRYDVYARKSDLIEAGKFKASVLAEMSNEVSLSAAVRDYISCIGKIQNLVRELTQNEIDRARGKIDSMHQRYKNLYVGDTIGLAALATSKDDKQNVVPLLVDWDDVRIELANRNSVPENLSALYVSTRVSPINPRRYD
ncbi:MULTISPECIES: hypothetical protein [Methylomonas]|uniref:Uncharacterized protein n=1 Tax=Methylomonas koyamae TaxID=702114 RepID=A0A177N595_9GAMM|nr:hypothetical protein [Methylomonas koyamae]OAI13001.1 hypothetical protein A1355_13820 [Methylomonas koyamae]